MINFNQKITYTNLKEIVPNRYFFTIVILVSLIVTITFSYLARNNYNGILLLQIKPFSSPEVAVESLNGLKNNLELMTRNRDNKIYDKCPINYRGNNPTKNIYIKYNDNKFKSIKIIIKANNVQKISECLDFIHQTINLINVSENKSTVDILENDLLNIFKKIKLESNNSDYALINLYEANRLKIFKIKEKIEILTKNNNEKIGIVSFKKEVYQNNNKENSVPIFMTSLLLLIGFGIIFNMVKDLLNENQRNL